MLPSISENRKVTVPVGRSTKKAYSVVEARAPHDDTCDAHGYQRVFLGFVEKNEVAQTLGRAEPAVRKLAERARVVRNPEKLKAIANEVT